MDGTPVRAPGPERAMAVQNFVLLPRAYTWTAANYLFLAEAHARRGSR
ncbi:hypothetical protein ACFWCA_29065 [Streptomyces phaeochromogenes]